MNYVLTPSAVGKLRTLIRGVSKVGGTTYPPGVVSPDDYPSPYTVRWAASANEGAGAWLIWLPTSALLYVNGEAVDVRTDLSQESDNTDSIYPSGWYDSTLPASGGTLYLAVHLPDEGTPTAEFSDEPVDPEADEQVVNIVVAIAAKDATTGAARARQNITSAITLGGGGGGSSIPGCYQIYNNGEGLGFTNRYYEVSGVIREGPDGDPADYAGKFLVLEVSSATALLQGYTTFAALQTAMMDQSRVVIPLYKFNAAGGIECDLRHLPRADMWSIWNVSNA